MCGILENGDIAGAPAGFVHAMTTAARFEDRELDTLARIGLGRCRIYLGEVAEGLRLLDEAMVAVEGREISPVAVGDSYCTVIDACRELFDLPRFEGWTESFTGWLRSQAGLAVYGGHCSLHRAELMLLRGDWADATTEADQAVSRLNRPRNLLSLGGAHYVRAEVYRLRGEFDAADGDYRRAHEHGCEPQPGLALLRLGQGRIDLAEAAIRRLEAEVTEPVVRARMLGAFSEIVLAAGDGTAAGAAADELAAVAREQASQYLTAAASHARAAVLLAAGEARSALVHARQAWRHWSELRTPHEGARTRVLLAEVCRALGDRETADLELEAARATFVELGARPDAERMAAAPARSRRPVPGPALGQGGRGPRAGRARRHQPGHRAAPAHQRAHGCQPRQPHLHQDRGHLPRRGHRLRLRAPSRRTRPNGGDADRERRRPGTEMTDRSAGDVSRSDQR